MPQNSTDQEQLWQFWQPQLGLSELELEAFLQLWQPQTRKKGEWLSAPYREEKYFYFVVEGVQRLLFTSDAGRDFTLGFSYAGEPSGLFHSFLLQQSTEVGVQCITDSRFLAIHRDGWQEAGQRWPAIERWTLSFVTRILMGRTQREIELLNHTAQERFQRFNARSGHLFLQVPHKIIAAYLGMSAETLSRLRAQSSD